MKSKLIALTMGAIVVGASSSAFAGEAFLGLYRHDIDDTISHGHYESSPSVIVGVKTARLEELPVIWKPRIHLLAGINARGGTSYIASGLSGDINLPKRFYVEPGIGIAIHDGKVNLPSPDEPGISAQEQAKRLRDWETKLDLGSRVLFEPELTFGWKANERLSFEASWIHLSHAHLAGYQNPGLGDLGIRLVYRYGVDAK